MNSTENSIAIYTGIVLSIIGIYFIYRALILDVLEITERNLIVKSLFGNTKKEIDLNDNSHLLSTSQSCNNSWVEFFFEPNEYIEFFVVEEFENLSVIEINEIIVTQNNHLNFNYEMQDETNLHWFDINNEISSLRIEIISSTQEAKPTLKCGLKDVWFYGRES